MSTEAPHHTIDVPYLARLARLEVTPEEIEILKKEKLLLKDQIYAVLKKANAS